MNKMPPQLKKGMKPKKKIKSIQDIRDAAKEMAEDPNEEAQESPMEEQVEEMPMKKTHKKGM